MILFRLISWPYLRKHGVRSILTLAGIVIGVSVFVAMHAANQAVFGAFQETVKRIAGATELQITAGEPGFGEEILERVQQVEEIRVASPVIESVAGTGLPGQGSLLILGVDMTGDRSLRDYELSSADDAVIEDPLVFLAQPDSIMITSTFAARNHLTVDQKVPLDTAEGQKLFTVRGILKSGGMNSAYGGNLAIMDIYAAQHVFGRGRRFDRIDIGLQDGANLSSVQTKLEKLLGPGFQVEEPSSRGQSFQSMLRVYYFMLNFSSVFALVVGMFLIYNSFSIAVTQRRGEIGILRALGATRWQISGLFLGESMLIGLAGSCLGAAVGYAAANAVANVLGGILQGIYGVARWESQVAVDPSLTATAIGIGVVTSVAAALAPARAAAALDPVHALQKGRIQALTETESRFRALLAGVFVLAGGLLYLSSQTMTLFYLSYACILLAVLIMTPWLSLGLSKLLRPLFRWLRPVEGALAADSLIGAPRRTSASVAALMLALALVVGLAGTAHASRQQITEWVRTTLNPDLFVTGSPTVTGRAYKFPNSMTAELEALDGVELVQRVKTVRVTVDRLPVSIVSVDLLSVSERAPREVLEGDKDEAYQKAGAGLGVLISENFSRLHKRTLSDMIDLPTPSGIVRQPVLAVIRDYSDQQGVVLMDRSLYVKLWKDDTVDLFRIYAAKSVTPSRLKERILNHFSGNRRVFVLMNEEVRSYISRLTDQWFGITWVQISISILVAILGIINSLTVSIADRRRELGVLRAVGGMPAQIRGTIWIEAVGIGLLGVLLGLGLGVIHLYFVLELSARDFPGLRFAYSYPLDVAAAIFPIILGAAFLSAVGPAEAAVRGSLVEALEYE